MLNKTKNCHTPSEIKNRQESFLDIDKKSSRQSERVIESSERDGLKDPLSEPRSDCNLLHLLSSDLNANLILKIDNKCQILWSNQETLNGNKNIIGWTCWAMLGSDGRCKKECILKKSMSDKESRRFEVSAEISDNTIHYYQITTSPLKVIRNKVESLLVFFNDISECKKIRKELDDTITELQLKKNELSDKSIALKEILNQIDYEKKQTNQHILSNLDKIVMPIIKQLEQRVQPSEIECITMLQNALSEITSPFINSLEIRYRKLTPREIEISNMVRKGMSSKSIATLFNLSEGTIRQQRKSIRKKLGITNDKINLTTFLNDLLTP